MHNFGLIQLLCEADSLTMDSYSVFTELLKFSWTLTALLFTAQCWLFSQEYKGNRVLKWRHAFLISSMLMNTISAICLFLLFNYLLHDVLSQDRNLLSENIKCVRRIYISSLGLASLLFAGSVLSWITLKAQRSSE